MKLAVLGVATDKACENEEHEGESYQELKSALHSFGIQIEAAYNLLGRYDYLFVLDVDGDVEESFRCMSIFAQSGMMRTESFVAIPLESYFDVAREINK
jgi:uncharacterized protein with GYD domain